MKVELKETVVEVPLKIGETMEEAVELVGAEVAHRLYKEGAERAGTAVIKRYMRKGWDEARIVEAMKDWTAAVVKVKIVDKVAKAQKFYEDLSAADKELFKAGLPQA